MRVLFRRAWVQGRVGTQEGILCLDTTVTPVRTSRLDICGFGPSFLTALMILGFLRGEIALPEAQGATVEAAMNERFQDRTESDPSRETGDKMQSPHPERLKKIEKGLRAYFSGIGVSPEFRKGNGRLEVLYRLARKSVLVPTSKLGNKWETHDVLAPITDGFHIVINLGADYIEQLVRPQTLISNGPDRKPLYVTYIWAGKALYYDFSYGLGLSEKVRRRIREAIEAEAGGIYLPWTLRPESQRKGSPGDPGSE
jgi:hypothetical protein